LFKWQAIKPWFEIWFTVRQNPIPQSKVHIPSLTSGLTSHTKLLLLAISLAERILWGIKLPSLSKFFFFFFQNLAHFIFHNCLVNMNSLNKVFTSPPQIVLHILLAPILPSRMVRNSVLIVLMIIWMDNLVKPDHCVWENPSIVYCLFFSVIENAAFIPCCYLLIHSF
jgi:hypothetical protein